MTERSADPTHSTPENGRLPNESPFDAAEGEGSAESAERTGQVESEEVNAAPAAEASAEEVPAGDGRTGFTDELAAMADVVLDPPQPGRPVVSPDGARYAMLQVDADGGRRVWIGSLSGDEAPTPLDLGVEPLDDPDGPQWSPDGSQLAFVAPHPADGRSAIWVGLVDGGPARMLVDHAAVDTSPRWSLDGALIAFLSRREDRAAAHIVAAEGLSAPVQVSHALPGQDDHDLTWGHDSKRLAFARRAWDGDKQGDHVWTYNVLTGESKQVTTRLNGRRQLRWAPDKAQIIFIADDSEWDNVAVVNPDNNAGWNIASEQGDKSDPAWAADGQRVVYARTMNGVTRLCERATSSSTAENPDPGDGTVSAPQLLPDKRVFYAYTPATGPTRFMVQEPKADAARTELPMAVTWSTDRQLMTPHHLEFDINDRRTGALRYQRTETAGKLPIVVVLRDHPERPRTAALSLLEQALAAEGMTVVVPTIAGTPGYGRKLSGALKAVTGSEAEVLDLVGFVNALSSIADVDTERIAVVGEGHGGTLALLLAGSRPGTVQAVAAIDPICDWNLELDRAGAARRRWLLETYGLPATNGGVYALRTPSTFAGVINVPLMLVGTDRVDADRAAQLDAFTVLLHELDVPFQQDVASTEPSWNTYTRVARFIAEQLRAIQSGNVGL